MSEFACINGHPMRAGQRVCWECGGRLHTMDGLTAREINKREIQEQIKRQEREDDEDED